VLSKGFAVDSIAKHTESKQEFVIVDIWETIDLRAARKEGATRISPAALLDEYTKVEPIREHTFANCEPLLRNDLKAELKNADLTKAVVKAYADHDQSNGVKLVLRGSRKHAYATRPFDSGALVLVPLRANINTT